jgi:hypothetical protein
MYKSHALFRRDRFFSHYPSQTPFEDRDIVWQSLIPGTEDWSPDCRELGFILNGKSAAGGSEPSFFIMVNSRRQTRKTFIVPDPPTGQDSRWLRLIDTALDSPDDFVDKADAQTVQAGSGYVIEPMALVVLQSTDPTSP